MLFEYHPLVQVSDQAGLPVNVMFQATAPIGFGHEGNGQWINYRRNHIQVDVELSMGSTKGPLQIQAPHVHYYQHQPRDDHNQLGPKTH